MLNSKTREIQQNFELFEQMTHLFTNCITEINKFKELYNIEFKPLPPVMTKGNKIYNNNKHKVFFEGVMKDKKKKAEMLEMIRDFEALREMLESVEIKVRAYLSNKKMNESSFTLERVL